jgi:hypothetical protein
VPENRRHRDDRTIPAVTTDDHHVTAPTNPPKPIIKLDDAVIIVIQRDGQHKR